MCCLFILIFLDVLLVFAFLSYSKIFYCFCSFTRVFIKVCDVKIKVSATIFIFDIWCCHFALRYVLVWVGVGAHFFLVRNTLNTKSSSGRRFLGTILWICQHRNFITTVLTCVFITSFWKTFMKSLATTEKKTNSCEYGVFTCKAIFFMKKTIFFLRKKQIFSDSLS